MNRLFVGARRRGATLLELMAVVLILLMITAVTVPQISLRAQGRRVREAARMFSVFLNAARNRAAETGRSAGVWIQRDPAVPEISDSIYFAELPQLYAGDFLDSTVEGFMVDITGQIVRPNTGGDDDGNYDAYTYPNRTPNGHEFWNLLAPRSRTTYAADLWSVPDPASQYLVRKGDQIQFEGIDRLYTLDYVEGCVVTTGGLFNTSFLNTTQTRWWRIITGANKDTLDAVTYHNKRNRYGEFTISWYLPNGLNTSYTGVFESPGDPFTHNTPGKRYKIYRQPAKLQAGSIRLPENTVIDLNFSSVTNGIRGQSGIPFHPRLDTTTTAATAVNYPYWGDSVFPDDETPVVLAFSPGGHLERLYCHYAYNTPLLKKWTWQGMEPMGDVYFLIGKRDHVNPGEAFRFNQPALVNYEIQMRKTWLDLESLWVKVTPQTGAIATSLLDDPGNADLYDYPDADAGLMAADPSNIWRTRIKTERMRVSGGR